MPKWAKGIAGREPQASETQVATDDESEADDDEADDDEQDDEQDSGCAISRAASDVYQEGINDINDPTTQVIIESQTEAETHVVIESQTQDVGDERDSNAHEGQCGEAPPRRLSTKTSMSPAQRDNPEDNWIVVWHSEEEKAIRTKIDGSQ